MSRIIYLVKKQDYEDVEYDKAFIRKAEAVARCAELNPKPRTQGGKEYKLFEEYLDSLAEWNYPWFIEEIDLVE